MAQDEETRRHNQVVRRWATIGGVIAVLTIVLALLSFQGPSGYWGELWDGLASGVVKPQAVVTESSKPSSETSTAVPTAVTAEESSEASASSPASANLIISQWCACQGRDSTSGQVIARVSVTNTSGEPIDISSSRFRLVVGSAPGWTWSPPNGVRVAEPSDVTTRTGESVLLLPPNADGVGEVFPSGGENWQTHWSGTVLPAGQTYALAERQRGVLVFYAPATVTSEAPDGQLDVRSVLLLGDNEQVIAQVEMSAEQVTPYPF